jgi:hypothetical protein
MITDKGPATPSNALSPTGGSFNSSPNLVVAGAPYVAWVQDDLLYFGKIETTP